MWTSEWAWLAGVGCGLTAGLLVLLDGRRLLVGVLAAQYALVAVLVAQSLPVSMAGAKLAAGLLTTTVLAMTVFARPGARQEAVGPRLPTGRGFRIAGVLLVMAIGVGLGYHPWSLTPGLEQASRLGSAFLVTLGLLHLGTTEEPLRVGVGMLTLLSGFEIPYALLEPSLAVTAMLAAIHLGTAVVVSYLLLAVVEMPGEGRL